MIDRVIQRNSTQDDGSQSSGGGIRRHVQPARVCTYPDFIKCQPLNFKGTKGVVGLSQWIEKMESVFYISSCVVENQVKFVACTLLGAALTWWNGHVRTLGHDVAYALTWGTFKKKLTDKYCPNGEIKKLEIELWNLKVKGNNVAAYTQHFQELALMFTKFLADETTKIDKYIGGLPDNIYGNVMSARPKTLDIAIELANDLMDQKLCTYAERQNENKRKAAHSSRNHHQQQPHKKRNVARAYTAGPGEKKGLYWGPTSVHQVQLPSHWTMCTQVWKMQEAGACYECGNTGHMRRDCPKLNNRGNGNRNGTAQRRAYALGGRDASPNKNWRSLCLEKVEDASPGTKNGHHRVLHFCRRAPYRFRHHPEMTGTSGTTSRKKLSDKKGFFMNHDLGAPLGSPVCSSRDKLDRLHVKRDYRELNLG
ncbi:putative reverse transcriptase domain-containing protein [Tanacetum coccineum]